MFESIFIWGAAIVLTFPFLIVALILCLIFEYKDCPWWAFITASISAMVAYHIYEVPSNYIFYAALAYIPVGIIWSFWRWKSYCNYILKEIEDDDEPTKFHINKTLDKLDPKNQVGKISSWIISWPWSFVAHFLRDVMLFIESLVTKHLNRIYIKLAGDAKERIRKIEPTK